MGVPSVSQLNALNNRVWYVEGGVHPTRAPEYLALGKFSDDPSKTIGEETKVGAPDPNSFNRDIQLGTVAGEEERATLAIGIRSTAQVSKLIDWKNRRCRIDVFALQGKCGNPQDFTEGGEKFTYFPDGKISAHNFENFGAWDMSENNPTNEMVDMTAEDYWEFHYMRQEQIAAAVTIREIYTVDIVPGDECEDCPDRYTQVLMTMAGASATPGTKPSMLYSSDKGVNWTSQDISTMFSNENIVDAAVLGGNFLVLSNTAAEFHWTNVTEIFENVNQWSQVPTGFLGSKAPNAMSALDVRHVWVVGNGGYVYFASDYKVGVEVQDAGVATTQHLRAVHALNTQNILAVGDNNAVIHSSNGGSTWESVTGPSVGVNMGACWMWSESVWFVLEGANGNGKAWLTTNSGITWTQKGLPGTYLRFDKIVFVSEAEGYISARTGGQSVILRTITGGYEWVTLPNGKKGTAIANQYLRDIAVTNKFMNTVYAAGLATNGTAGIVLRMNA